MRKNRRHLKKPIRLALQALGMLVLAALLAIALTFGIVEAHYQALERANNIGMNIGGK